jgi:hypothetical protein
VQQFAPGLALNFIINATSNDDAGFPDRFTFFVLDSSGNPIPTLAPFADYFFGVDLGSGGPNVDSYGSDDSRSLTVGGPVSIGAPKITSVVATPEPGSGLLVVSGIASLLGLGRIRSRWSANVLT